MSRYNVPADMVIGYDQPTAVFFAQEFDADDELLGEYENHHLAPVLAWLGERGVTVPRNIIDRVISDSEQPWTPGPLQKALGFEGRP